jgi:hypothetical protein
MRFVDPLERIVLTLWVGGMWSVGYLVAPVLFSMLDSKTVAGNIAGRLFSYLGIAGLVCGGFLLVVFIWQHGISAVWSWRAWVLVTMLGVTAAGQFWILPRMDALKRLGGGHIPPAGEIAARFGALHVGSTALFVLNSMLGLLLVATGLGRQG